MLHNILIITSSGLVIFSKSFSNALQVETFRTILGALVRTIIELTHTTTNGLMLSYLEMDSVALSICDHPDLPIYCAVFLDIDSGSEVWNSLGYNTISESSQSTPILGKMIATKLISAFVEEHGADLEGAVGHSTSTYRGFSYRISGLLRECCKTLMRELLMCDIIHAMVLVSDDGTTDSVHRESSLIEGRRDVDDVTVISTVRPMLVAAAELMSTTGDVCNILTTEVSIGFRLIQWKIEGSTLLILMNSEVQFAPPALGRYAHTLQLLHHMTRMVMMVKPGMGPSVANGLQEGKGDLLSLDSDIDGIGPWTLI